MKKWWGIAGAAALALLTVSCGQANSPGQLMTSVTKKAAASQMGETGKQMRLRTEDGREIVFALNGSPAADSLYRQLPLTVKVENFSTNEKIFYPPEKLPVSGTPHGESGTPGTLAYYAPWGDVVLFYGGYSPHKDLYELGQVQSGGEYISRISGEVWLEP